MDGGYALAPGAALPPLVLDDDEAVALALGLQAAAVSPVGGMAESSVRALAKGIRKAVVLFQTPALFEHYRQNAMRADFSWERTAQSYLDIYRSVLGR